MWKVVKKGYCLDVDTIGQKAYEYDWVYCVADDMEQAKSILFKKMEFLDSSLTYRNYYANDFPVKECEKHDMVEFDGNEMSRESATMLQKYLDKKVENDKILNDSSVKFVFIKKDGWCYRENYCGYTEYPIEAGVYTKEDAHKHCGNILELNIVPINIEYYNALIQETINKLQTKILEP